ncbi:hypothetical protein ACIQUQ_15010 [Streptomyces sp. NPDC101118]|uniref:hypothetical protein n=1 Tax=Streptomyces sp. NPDC101118 TaxID=3366109 RepID=UPI00381F520D
MGEGERAALFGCRSLRNGAAVAAAQFTVLGLGYAVWSWGRYGLPEYGADLACPFLVVPVAAAVFGTLQAVFLTGPAVLTGQYLAGRLPGPGALWRLLPLPLVAGVVAGLLCRDQGPYLPDFGVVWACVTALGLLPALAAGVLERRAAERAERAEKGVRA